MKTHLLGGYTILGRSPQFCSVNMAASAPDSRYTVKPDGTVIDKKTNLMWKQCVEGQSQNQCTVGTPTQFDWVSAPGAASSSTFAGHTDWRVPNTKELFTLLETSCSTPSMNVQIFPTVDVAMNYGLISSSYLVGTNAGVEGVNFRSGFSLGGLGSNQTGFYTLRLVRDNK